MAAQGGGLDNRQSLERANANGRRQRRLDIMTIHRDQGRSVAAAREIARHRGRGSQTEGLLGRARYLLEMNLQRGRARGRDGVPGHALEVASRAGGLEPPVDTVFTECATATAFARLSAVP